MEDADEVSRRKKDLDTSKYYSSESAQKEQEKKKGFKDGLDQIAREKRLQLKFKALKSFRIIGSDGNQSTKRASVPRILSSTERKVHNLSLLPTKSTTNLPRGAISLNREVRQHLFQVKSHRPSSSGSFNTFKGKEVLQITERSKTLELLGNYVIEFNTNFITILNSIKTYADRRLKSLETRQRVFRRYEKKKRLLKEGKVEQMIKIYGPKVKTINFKNDHGIKIDLANKTTRQKL